MAGTFTVTGLSAGLGTGSKTVGPITITGSNIVGGISDATLNSGDNTFTVPPNAVAVYVYFPAANTATLRIRTSLNSGDTGLPVAAGDPFGPYSFRGLSPTTVIINASGSVVGVELSFI